MRLRKLTLCKYGSVAEQTLQFADGPGLSIIYGPNEAGKSTALSALTDFLFGIPNISAHTGHFGPEGMRIGATLQAADGTQWVLERRRGRGKTRPLLNAEGDVQSERVLEAMLGTTTRERFGILFGLNHESLRTGGDALLAADGEIGRLIVEAGGGLSALMTRLGALDEEAATYFAPHASKTRAFYQARHSFNEAQAKIDRLELSYHAFQKAQDKAQRAQAHLAAHKKTRELRAQAVVQAERLMKIAPELMRLDALQAQLDQDKAAAAFGAHFDAHVDEALRHHAQAQHWLDEAQTQAASAQAAVQALPGVQTTLLDAEADILDVVHHARAVQANESQMHRLRQSVSERAEALEALSARLGVAPAELNQANMPQAQRLEEVRRLIAAHKSQAPLLQERRVQRDGLERQVEALRARCQNAEARGLLDPLEIEAEGLRPIASIDAELAARGQAQLRARHALDAAVEGLGVANIEQLQRLACPEAAHIDAAAEEARRLEHTRLQHAQAHLEHQATQQRAQAELSALADGAQGVSRQEVKRARAARDALLKPVADSFVRGHAAQTEEMRQASVLQLRAAMREADDLVDQLSQQAERAAQVQMCRTRIEAAQAGIAHASAQIALLDSHIQAHAAQWNAAFAQAAALEPTLVGLQRLVHARDALLLRHAACVADETQHAADWAQNALLVAQLGQAEARLQLRPPQDAPLIARRDAVFRALQAHADGRRDALREQAELARLTTELDAATTQLDAMRQSADESDAAWRSALSAAGLCGETTLEQAADRIASWMQARELLIASQAEGDQLEQLRAAGARLQQSTRALAARLELPLSQHPVATAELLRTRLDETKQLRERHQSAQVALAQALKQRDERRQGRAQADTALAALATRAQLPGAEGAALRQAAARYAAYQARLAEREHCLRVVETLADGQSLDAVRAAWAGRDAETLAAALADAQAARRQVEHDIEAAWGAQKEASLQLQEFEGDNGVNLAHAQRAQAIAELHAAAERYVELSVAKQLIATAMNTLRSARKSPLLQRASQLFSATTKGRYAGVGTDVDLKGTPIVVGQKPDGSTVKVATMSDGTRDQLFLAFRLASLEQYARQAEPLPFVADDILVHFDDSRGAATLDVLAQFAQTTQVLLFTHHKSVVDASDKLVAAGLAQVVSLGA